MPENLTELLSKLASQDYCYLTTTGRVTGRPHEIEIWFGAGENSLYLLSGGGGDSDWVKNLLKKPGVTVRIAQYVFAATARLVTGGEETAARHLLAGKYHEWEEGRTLSEWARTALVVGIDLDSILKSS